MSLLALAGALIAIIIVCLIVRAILSVFPFAAQYATAIWCIVGAICLLLLAIGLGLDVPFFRM